MRRLLIPLFCSICLPSAINAETIYLLIQTNVTNPAFSVIPMESKTKCEEAGILYISSERLKTFSSSRGFECFVGR